MFGQILPYWPLIPAVEMPDKLLATIPIFLWSPRTNPGLYVSSRGEGGLVSTLNPQRAIGMKSHQVPSFPAS